MSQITTAPAPIVRATSDGGFEIRYDLPDLNLRAIPSTRADGEEWDAEGWAVVYGVEDTWGTTFVGGCFTALSALLDLYPLLHMHDRNNPVGVFIVEDRPEGLWIKIRFDNSTSGDDARARARSGSMPGLSVGFIWYPTVEQQAGEADPNLILCAVLVETSQITRGMQAVPGAELQAVRSKIGLVQEGGEDTQRSAESDGQGDGDPEARAQEDEAAEVLRSQADEIALWAFRTAS